MAEAGFDLNYTQEKLGEDVLTAITLPNNVNAANATTIRAQLNEIIESNKTHIALELSDVKFMDSMGLSVLISSLRACRTLEKRLGLIGMSKQVQLLFSITGMESVFEIYSSLEDFKTSLQ